VKLSNETCAKIAATLDFRPDVASVPAGTVVELRYGAADTLCSGVPVWAALISLTDGGREISARQPYQFGTDGSSPAATFEATARSAEAVVAFFLDAEGGGPVAFAAPSQDWVRA
jgi:hypothetical protein